MLDFSLIGKAIRQEPLTSFWSCKVQLRVRSRREICWRRVMERSRLSVYPSSDNGWEIFFRVDLSPFLLKVCHDDISCWFHDWQQRHKLIKFSMPSVRLKQDVMCTTSILPSRSVLASLTGPYLYSQACCIDAESYFYWVRYHILHKESRMSECNITKHSFWCCNQAHYARVKINWEISSIYARCGALNHKWTLI